MKKKQGARNQQPAAIPPLKKTHQNSPFEELIPQIPPLKGVRGMFLLNTKDLLLTIFDFFSSASARKNGGEQAGMWAEASFFLDFLVLFYQEKSTRNNNSLVENSCLHPDIKIVEALTRRGEFFFPLSIA